MQKVKWFLIGVILAVCATDWVRLKIERVERAQQEERLIDLAQFQATQVQRCEVTLTKGRHMLEEAQVAYLARVQTIDLLAKDRGNSFKQDADEKFLVQLARNKTVFDPEE